MAAPDVTALDIAAPDITERIAEHRRLCILRALADDPAGRLRRDLLTTLVVADGSANLSLLTDCLGDLGYQVTRDQVHTTAAWCVAQGLAAPQPDGDIAGWHLTDAGADVVAGRGGGPGVAAPATVDWIVVRLGRLSVKTGFDQVVQDWGWLEDHGLVAEGMTRLALRLTPRGADVAAGRVTVEGVKKPSYNSILNAAATVGKSILGG